MGSAMKRDILAISNDGIVFQWTVALTFSEEGFGIQLNQSCLYESIETGTICILKRLQGNIVVFLHSSCRDPNTQMYRASLKKTIAFLIENKIPIYNDYEKMLQEVYKNDS